MNRLLRATVPQGKGKSYGFALIMVVSLAITLLASLLSLSEPPASASGEQPLRVGFVMVGPVSDHGWNYAHDQGRRFLEAKMKEKVETTYAEKVPESAEAERVMEKMIAHGCKLIFSTSYGYLEPAQRVAGRHHDVVIMQCQRSVPPNSKNVGTYFVKQYEPFYVAGYISGMVTKKNKLAYIGGHPVPEVINCLDSFTLGARAANPKAEVQVIWLNTWSDPALEAEATRGAVEQGADIVVAQLSSGETTLRTAEKLGVLGIGCSADLSKQAPKAWLTGQVFNWGPLYVQIVDSVIKHSWKPENQIFGMKEGYIGLGPFGSAVNSKMKSEAMEIVRALIDGKLYIFQGPLSDRSGKMRISAGKRADYNEIGKINWLVQGVQGSLPNK
jgi:basic membrane protein A and related proteins